MSIVFVFQISLCGRWETPGHYRMCRDSVLIHNRGLAIAAYRVARRSFTTRSLVSCYLEYTRLSHGRLPLRVIKWIPQSSSHLLTPSVGDHLANTFVLYSMLHSLHYLFWASPHSHVRSRSPVTSGPLPTIVFAYSLRLRTATN